MDDDPQLKRLARRRWTIGLVLTLAMMAAYFGFILLVAFGKQTAGSLLAGGRVSVGIVLGASVIVVAPILTGIYVWWANRRYDPDVAAMRKK